MIKLIATDVDGTLVKDGTMQIDPEYMTVIKELVQKGIIFAVCSGRQFISERKLFAPIKDQLLYITDGGTVVRTPQEILMVHTMPRDVCAAWCRNRCRTATVLSPHRTTVSPKTPEAACSTGCAIPTATISGRQSVYLTSRSRISSSSPSTTNLPVRKCVRRSSPRHGRTRHSLPPPAKSGWTAIRSVRTREPRSSSCRSISAFHRKRPARSEIT